MKTKDISTIRTFLEVHGIEVGEETIRLIGEKQEKKCLRKYGVTLENCPYDDYNWVEMMIEELVDFMAYKNKYESKI